jgi:hypothetical protein
MVLLKVVIEVSILELRNTKLLDDFAFGPQLGVADGIALANKLKKNGKVTAVFTGEGATTKVIFTKHLLLRFGNCQLCL